MTPQDVVNTVWDLLGRPDDISPDSTLWVDVLNAAQNRIATWKDPTTGFPVELFELIDSANVAVGPIEFTSRDTADGFPDRVRVGNAAGGTTIGSFKNHLIDIENNTRTIMSVEPDGTTHSIVYLNRELPAPIEELNENASVPVVVYGRGFAMPSGAIDIYNVENTTERYRLAIGSNRASFVELSEVVGRPVKWYILGRNIWFDSAPGVKTWFRVEYFRMPTAITAIPTGSFEIPAIFHEGIVLLAAEWGYRRYGESNEKYSIKRDFIDFMRSARGEYDRQYTRHQGKIERR